MDKRFEFIDIAKGIGMLLIIWGHTGYWGIIGELMYIINLFHIPLFFFYRESFYHIINPFLILLLRKQVGY